MEGKQQRSKFQDLPLQDLNDQRPEFAFVFGSWFTLYDDRSECLTRASATTTNCGVIAREQDTPTDRPNYQFAGEV